MPLFGSSSSTDKTTNVTNDQDTQIAEDQAVVSEGGGNITVNRTDAGAIQGGVDLGKAGLDFAEGMGSRALDVVDQTSGDAFDFSGNVAGQAIEAVSDQGRKGLQVVSQNSLEGQDNIARAYERANRSESTEQQKMLVTGAIALVAVGGIFMVMQANG